MYPIYTNGVIYNESPYAPPPTQNFQRVLLRQQTCPVEPNHHYLNYHEHSPLVNARIQEEMYYSSLSQHTTSPTLRYSGLQESGYGSDKDPAPRSIKIRPCSRPLIETEGIEEKKQGYQDPYMSGYNSVVRNAGSNQVQSGYMTHGNRYQHSNSVPAVMPIQVEPKSATAKIDEKLSPKTQEKKIVFDMTASNPHPTRDHLSPDPIRYAKMSEEDAAQAYEARKKALLDNLAKHTEKNPKATTTKKVPSRAQSKERGASKERVSSAVNKNKTTSNVASVPITGVKSELERGKKRKEDSNKEQMSLKINPDQEASSLPQSSFVSPKRVDINPPKNEKKDSHVVSKPILQGHHTVKKPAQAETGPKVVSYNLNEKKESRVDPVKGYEDSEEKVELKKIFSKGTLGFKSHPIQPKEKAVDKTYQADDEYTQRDNFRLSPTTRRTGNSNNTSQDIYTRGSATGLEREYQADKADMAHLDSSRRVKTAVDEQDLLPVGNGGLVGNTNDIKSKFIRRKLQANDDKKDQENRHNHILQSSDKDILPYSVLNEKGFESHHEYLHERALLQKKNRNIAFQHKKTQITERETEGCTFRPTIVSSPKVRESIIEKTRKWQAAKEQQIMENKVAAIEKEMMECTFYPNNSLSNSEKGHYNFKNFFERNKEWDQKRSEEIRRKEEELYCSNHAPSIRPSHVSTFAKTFSGQPAAKRSCCQEKEMASPKAPSNKLVKSPPGLKNRAKASSGNLNQHQHQHQLEHEHHHHHHQIQEDYGHNQDHLYDRRSHRNVIDESENKNNHSHLEKSGERTTTVINHLDPIQETQQNFKSALETAIQPFDHIAEEKQAKKEISQSFGIIEQLKHVIADKDEVEKPKEKGKKRDLDLILKTTGDIFLKQCNSLEALNHPESHRKSRSALKSDRDSISPSKGHGSIVKEVPATSLDYKSEVFQGHNYGVMLKNHKYYLSPKSGLGSDIKKRGDFNTLTAVKVADFFNEGDTGAKGKGILIQGNYNTHSGKKNKNVGWSPSKELDFSQTSFKYVPNDVNTVPDPYPTITKKYAEILSKAGNITRQLEQIAYGDN